MRETLTRIIFQAVQEQQVMMMSLSDGLVVFAYPATEKVLLGLGLGRDEVHRVNSTELLKKRGSNMSRYGQWRPVSFVDGAIYVVCDLGVPDEVVCARYAEDLTVAKELFT
ncbi:hypothetical protein [Undibacterium sp. TS12]|uniref:hypothetical protein n=1 Tax=Undibacterium sp. TS12 TaxID=2908202 RepID=UPI001F4CE3FA|nr:hypothetical protein [Undibacterium sp. TS12]MCH8621947.1 hypothetical protein [Undibacterium sp. TS12]